MHSCIPRTALSGHRPKVSSGEFLRTLRNSPILADMARPRGLSVAGNRIRDRRLELTKTQREMAEIAGIGVSTWANYENGHQDRASTTALRKVALALRLDLDEVVAARPQSASPEPSRKES